MWQMQHGKKCNNKINLMQNSVITSNKLMYRSGIAPCAPDQLNSVRNVLVETALKTATLPLLTACVALGDHGDEVAVWICACSKSDKVFSYKHSCEVFSLNFFHL